MADDHQPTVDGEALEALWKRRGPLSPEEVALLRKVFPEILEAHHDRVWNHLRRRGIHEAEIEDLVQEVFITLFRKIVAEGYPENLPGLIGAITEGLFLNHVRGRKRSPVSVALPSSGSEKPRSGPDIERALDCWALAEKVMPLLTPEHRALMELVVTHKLTLPEAAEVLGLKEGTAKSRFVAAKRAWLTHAAPFLPAKQ